jgi:hypothetical protein
MSPSKSSCIEGVVPSAVMFRGRAFGRRLNHEGSDLISGSSHWCIHNLMGNGVSLEEVGTHECINRLSGSSM